MTILVIEDEFKIAHLIKNGLENEGFSVEMAHDGIEGLVKAEKDNYDLIILDMMLPGMNGMDVCKTLRKKNIKTPVVMLTAKDNDEDRALGIASGANDYLAKPFIFRELIDSINNLLEKEKKKEPIVYVTKAEKKISKEEGDKMNTLNQSILDNAPVSIITIDKEGNITSANKFYQNFSKDGDYHNHNIFRGRFFQKHNLAGDYKKLLEDGTPVERESCHERNQKGEDKYLKILAAPIRDKDGKIEGALSMALDNTETVLYKNKLEELNQDLEIKVQERTVELRAVNKELANVLELKSKFMADVSHEMRTSLTIIQGNFELMARAKELGRDASESNEQIYHEIKRMSTMLSDLTSLTNAESASQKLNYGKVDLDQLISSVCTSLDVLAIKRDIKINHKKNIEKIEIMADEDKLDKLLSNLIRNAIRYNKESGWVNVWAEKAGNNVLLNVEDNGVGIPVEHLPNIFERFYRVDQSRSRNNGGSGLGLAICKQIAELHGGVIDVRSKIGQGTQFIVRLSNGNKSS